MPDYTLSAKMTGDSSSYQKAVEDADTATDQFQKNTSSLGSRLAGGLKSGLSIAAGAIAGVTTAMGAGAAAGVKYNATIEQYETSFEVMTGSAEKAAEVVDRLKKIGAETPFEMPQLAETTQLLMNYGFTADDAMDKMMMLGDISQGSADKMSRIAMAYGQMSSAGKVQLEDVKQMIEAGFNPLQEISESTGESMESLYDRISNGTLAVDEITASMQRATSEGGKYYQSMEKQSQTVTGLISTLKDNAQQLLGEVVQPITESIGTKLLPAAINAIDQLTQAFQNGGTQGLITAGGQIIANVVTGIAQAIPNVLTIAIQIIQNILSSLQNNLPQLVASGGQIIMSLLSGMMQLLPQIGVFILSLIQEIYTQLTASAPSLLQQGYQLLNNIITGFVQNIPVVLPQILSFIQQIGDGLAAAAPTLIQKGFELLSKLVEGITTAIPILIAKVPEIISTFANIINDNFPTILMKGVELLGQLIAGIIQAIPTLVANIPKIVSAIVDVIQAFNWLSLGKNIITFFKNGITSMIGAVKSTAQKMQNNIINAIKNLPSKLMNLGKSAVTNLRNVLQSGISGITSAAKNIANGIVNAIRNLPSILANHARNAVSDIRNAFTSINWGSIGSNIIDGIANGIAGAIGGLVDAAIDAAQSAFNAAKSFLGIQSPSTLFRDEIGLNMALGMGIGFEDNIPVKDINHALDGAVNKISGYYIDVGKRINPIDVITSTARVAESYQADVSNIFDGVVIAIDNTTNLDGAPIYRKSAEYTVKYIGNQQKIVSRSKGASL